MTVHGLDISENFRQVVLVKQEHINKGDYSECYCCPIALAMNNALPDGFHAEVKSTFAIVWFGYKRVLTVRLPKRVRRFIRMFDSKVSMANRNHVYRKSVKPFIFILRQSNVLAEVSQ